MESSSISFDILSHSPPPLLSLVCDYVFDWLESTIAQFLNYALGYSERVSIWSKRVEETAIVGRYLTSTFLLIGLLLR
jgi:hypothetical protein